MGGRVGGRALLAGLLLAAPAACQGQSALPGGGRATLSVQEALGDDPGAYARALEPRPFTFPQDHGPHPDFRTEWWYWTGNLETGAGRRFGYQVTYFRSALAPGPVERASAWATRQAWMAHLAVTDAGGGDFHAFERFARGALGLAGARAAPFRVWLEDWEAASVAPGATFPLRLTAAAAPGDRAARTLPGAGGRVALDLEMTPLKEHVLQGDRGLSRKGAEPGNASYYYSLTRLDTRGTVEVDGERFRVTGRSWLDREWSTSALEADQVGWDWFSLQLDDGSELMYYRLRRRDGGADPHSRGVLVGAYGATTTLRPDDVELRATGRWESPRGGVYPSGWVLTVPGRTLELRLRPLLADQELDLAFRYWEGAVDVEGTRRGVPVAGQGYVELTGYADAPVPSGPW